VTKVYAWTLRYDNGEAETVRASTPTRAVARRTHFSLPHTVSSRHLVRGLREAHLLRTPLMERFDLDEREGYTYPTTRNGHAEWCSGWSPCHDTGVRGRRVQP
jgi:hypothetical protein